MGQREWAKRWPTLAKSGLSHAPSNSDPSCPRVNQGVGQVGQRCSNVAVSLDTCGARRGIAMGGCLAGNLSATSKKLWYISHDRPLHGNVARSGQVSDPSPSKSQQARSGSVKCGQVVPDFSGPYGSTLRANSDDSELKLACTETVLAGFGRVLPKLVKVLPQLATSGPESAEFGSSARRRWPNSAQIESSLGPKVGPDSKTNQRVRQSWA